MVEKNYISQNMDIDKPREKRSPLISLSRRLSMQQRLPILICLLLLIVIISFSWISYTGVKKAALQIGKERLTSLTEQLSSLFGQSALPLTAATHAASNQQSIKNYLIQGGKTTDTSALNELERLRLDSTWVLVELVNKNYLPILYSGNSSLSKKIKSDSVIYGSSVGPDSCKIGNFYQVNDSIYYPIIATVTEKKQISGYLIRWRLQLATPKALAQLSQLLGSNAQLYVGNTDGSLWTDMGKSVSAPPIDLKHINNFFEYSPTYGNKVVATGHRIINTPWLVVVEFSQKTILETASRFLRGFIILGAILLLVAFFIAWILSRNLTRPINKLTQVASAIAAGDYSQNAETNRADEIGKLAYSFNSMMEQIRNSQYTLERTVQERTVQLKKNIEQLKESEERFKGLLESAPDAIVIVDTEGKIVLVNQQTENLFGYTREELINQKVEILVPENFHSQHVQHRANYFKDPKVRAMGVGIELFALRKDGSQFPVEISLAPLKTAEGILVSAAIRDITERKRIEERLKATNKELEAFSYSVSHDLRAPLRIIDGYAEVLITDYKDKLDSEGKRVIDIITNNARKMGNLIDDLLNLSHLGRKEMILLDVNMTKLVSSVISEMNFPGIERAEIKLGKLESAYCDMSLIRQVWVNLISNAIKYSAVKAKPLIEMSSIKKGSEIIYSIRDNGVGFDMRHADKLFGVFQRLHKMTEFEGTGVGLALVHRIITKHGGRVWAEAEVDKGATFYFSMLVGRREELRVKS